MSDTDDQRRVLTIEDLSVVYDTPNGPRTAVEGATLHVDAGETVAVVGESGSGKSTLASSVIRLLAADGRIAHGRIVLDGIDLQTQSDRAMVRIRGQHVGLVPQDPMTSLNPTMKVGAQIAEALTAHGRMSKDEAKREAVSLLDRVGLSEPEVRAGQFPHEFSGGMRQRVLIAIALACRPRLLLADEPTSGLDVTVQRVVLDEMQRLAHEIGAGVLLITHDLALALERADRIVVMHDGRIVESGTAQALSTAPQTDYARRLLGAAPGMVATPLIATSPAAPEATPASAPASEPLLELDGVRQTYRVRGRREPFVALEGISLTVSAGETVALVGESGSGKSTTARLALRLEDPAAGAIRFEGSDITHSRGAALLPFRRSVQPVFQNPYASLDPRRTIAETISEPLAVHRIGDGRSRRRRVAELLDRVALPTDTASRYPAELSGGQRQRVAIARALALEPRLVVMDEAVSALDVLVQEQILELMVSLQHDTGLSFLFISHDLAVVRLVSHYAYVLQHGQMVESGAPDELFRHPHHAYTQRLVEAIPGTHLREEV
ncbi:MAG: ABC transporter ATP-binding protein [Pseudoclavibacter sp.]|jgi:peptide/nickel transport system ATP-binding protein